MTSSMVHPSYCTNDTCFGGHCEKLKEDTIGGNSPAVWA